MLTLKSCAHAMRDEETDLSSAELGGSERPGRPYTAPGLDRDRAGEDAAEGPPRRRSGKLEHETGLEPATPTLATPSEPVEDSDLAP